MDDAALSARPAGQRASATRIRVWDLPTRLFHWALVALVVVSLYTGNVGGLTEMELHMYAGYGVLALVLFRLGWGVVGSRHSRFAAFVRGRGAVIAYVRDLIAGAHAPSLGHNPLGGWSVVAMLASLLLQAVTGLFAHDDVFTKGPLAKYVSKSMSDALTEVHEINANLLYLLIGVHLLAVFGYLLVHRENLIRPMLTGRKPATAALAGEDGAFASSWKALALLALAGAAVWVAVTW